MIGDVTVAYTVFDHVSGYVAFIGVHKACRDGAVCLEFGDGVKLVLVEKALGEGTVDFFTDTAVLAVDEVVKGDVTG